MTVGAGTSTQKCDMFDDPTIYDEKYVLPTPPKPKKRKAVENVSLIGVWLPKLTGRGKQVCTLERS